MTVTGHDSPTEAPESTSDTRSFPVRLEAGDPEDLLVLSGPIHMEAAAQLREHALHLAAARRPFAIDWRDAEYVGGSALQVLLGLAVAVGGPEGTLRVKGDHPGVRRILECAGLSGRFRVESVEG